MKKAKIYLAGPLFTEPEVEKRREQARLIRELYKSKNIDMELYNPIELNDTVKDMSKKPSYWFFENDLDFIVHSDLMIVDIDNLDSGTLIEFGYFAAMKEYVNKNLKIIVYGSDWSVNLFREHKMNKFLNGMIIKYATYVTSNKELLETIDKMISK